MSVLEKEFKKKKPNKKKSFSKAKPYKPRIENISVGKNDSKLPIPSYWNLR